jgi:hypothetical protein
LNGKKRKAASKIGSFFVIRVNKPRVNTKYVDEIDAK